MDQLPRQSLALPCTNLVDAPGGYRGSTFGECTPVSVSPAITTHCLVAPNFDKLRSAPPRPRLQTPPPVSAAPPARPPQPRRTWC